MSEPLLVVSDLVKFYPRRRAALFGPRPPPLCAVDVVSFTLERGEALGLVGESGSGKSSVARLLVGLERATSGSMRFAGTELTTLAPAPRRCSSRWASPRTSRDATRTSSRAASASASASRARSPSNPN